MRLWLWWAALVTLAAASVGTFGVDGGLTRKSTRLAYLGTRIAYAVRSPVWGGAAPVVSGRRWGRRPPAISFQNRGGASSVSKRCMMEVWLEGDLDATEEEDPQRKGIDRRLGQSVVVGDNDKLFMDHRQVGCVVDVSTPQGQSRARSLCGSVEWLLLEFGNHNPPTTELPADPAWMMIPVENVLSWCDGTPTRVAVRIPPFASVDVIPGLAFALERGVDALLVPSTTPAALLEAARIAKSQRAEQMPSDHTHNDKMVATKESPSSSSRVRLQELPICRVMDGGVGDRVCVDLTCLLSPGEGLLVGSSSSSLLLVHGETVPSEFVPTRPFRVNAGAVHAYVLLADGNSTKYLSELRMGDGVQIVQASTGQCRTGIVGRCKVERRPFLAVWWKYPVPKNSPQDEKEEEAVEAGTMLQQAETVRLVSPDGECVSVTSLQPGTSRVLGWISPSAGLARHVGTQVSGKVQEV